MFSKIITFTKNIIVTACAITNAIICVQKDINKGRTRNKYKLSRQEIILSIVKNVIKKASTAKVIIRIRIKLNIDIFPIDISVADLLSCNESAIYYIKKL